VGAQDLITSPKKNHQEATRFAKKERNGLDVLQELEKGKKG